MTTTDQRILDAKLPVGKPWVAGREVWVCGLFAGRGRGVYRVARLPSELVAVRITERELNALYNEWVRTRQTISEDQVAAVLFADALRHDGRERNPLFNGMPGRYSRRV